MRTLVAGASGFVGRALTAALVDEGHAVRAVARRRFEAGAGVEVWVGDVGDEARMQAALSGVRVAFYLAHAVGTRGFRRRDWEGAARFGAAAAGAGVEQIVYLSALGAADGRRTPHISSRHEVGEALRLGGVEVCELRAAVVVGRGSAMVELFRTLIERSPVLFAPWGSDRRVQPIALADAVRCLLAPLTDRRFGGRTLEIGGAEVLTWQALADRCGVAMGRRRRQWRSRLATPRLSGLWMERFGGMPRGMATAFIRNLGRDAVVTDDRAMRWVGGARVPLDAALRRALVTPGEGAG